MEDEPFPAWSRTVEQCLREYNVTLEKGLDTYDVEKRRERYGWNELSREKGKPMWLLLLNQFDDILVKILLVAASISFVLAYTHENETGDSAFAAYVEPFVIMLILVLNAIVGAWQETNAEKALDALKEMQCESGKVLRDGHLVPDLPARDLVPGDIVELRVGDKVPADMRIVALKTSTFRVEQSSLTGETAPILKGTSPVLMDECELQAKENMVFSSTVVVNGCCTCVVVSTGMNTEIGKIQKQIHEASLEETDTPLKKKLDEFGGRLTTVIGLACLVVWVTNYKNFLSWEIVNGWPANIQFSFQKCTYYFEIAVALAVAAIPEGLPAVITTCLALGTRKMAQKNAIVRKLPSVETLGCTTVICSDKTGTLTTNQMSVAEFFTLGGKPTSLRTFSVQGTTYDPRDGGIAEWNCYNLDASLQSVAEICAVCNDADVYNDGRLFRANGLPTEAAIMVLVEKMGVPDAKLKSRSRDPRLASNYLIDYRTVNLGCCDWWKKRSKRVATLEFDRIRKSMSVIVQEPTGRSRLLVKGAVENLLDRSSYVQLADGSVVGLDESCRQLLLSRNTEMSSKGLRCLGLAYKDEMGEFSDYCNDSHPAHKKLLDPASYSLIENHLIFVGVVGLRDPPREGIDKAIADCRRAGIKVLVITGDNKSTAEAICQEIKLFTENQDLRGRTFTGREFMDLSRPEQIGILEKPGGIVFSWAEPWHKQEIVRILKGMDHVVAMTGDGVNDAPALKLADIGIAMGINGTEAIELKRAVNECRIFMVIFSKNYASSTWCLKELAMIFDLHRNAGAAKKMILPIFYDVDLRDVMLRTGLYRGALDENKRKYGPDIVRKWEEALIKVGHTAGWSPTDISGQGKFSKQIVLDVLSKLKIRNRSLPEHLTGIQDQVDEMLKLLNCSSPEIRCVVVHGASGIGKTTLASTVFNEISSHFEGCSFIPNLRKSSQRRVGILKLQEKLLDDMLRTTQRASTFTNRKALADATDGIDTIRRRLCGRRVLIVLDDLDKEDQLNKLLGDCDWLGPTTRIIITTTNQSVGDGLMVPGVISTLEMKGLADDRALQLFSRHAFGEDNPPDDRIMASKRTVHAVRNLPLALEVIGGHLCGETKEVWKYTLQTLEEAPGKLTEKAWEQTSQILGETPHKLIREVLSISYRGLNDREREIFHDIARLSREPPKRYASDMWEDLDDKSALLTLARKSLIKFIPGDEIWMHDTIQELGGQMLLFEMLHNFYGTIDRQRTTSEDAFHLKHRKVVDKPASGFRGTSDVPELTSEHASAREDWRVLPGQPRFTISDDMFVDDEGPSTEHAAQTSPKDINLEVEMEERDEESSEALARSPREAQLAANEHLIDIQHKLDAVVELMNMDSDGIGIIGICGSDGYGKKTLVKALCSLLSPQFDACCFLEDVRETMLLPHGIQSLQNQLTRDIQMGKCGEGVPPARRLEALSELEHPHTKVIIVLDGIKDFSHIKELIGDKLSDRFGSGSRIIVTARGNHVDVENLGGDWVTIHRISEMNEDSALRLFSQHAFGQDSPIPGYRGIAKTMISGFKMCPLLIEIIGSLLRGKISDEFLRMSKLIEPLTHGLRDILRMSYDMLDVTQKQIFLDIACFVGNEDVRTAAYMWHDCLHEYPNRILVPHVKVGEDYRLWMHSSVRSQGREIVCAEGSVVHSGMCSRVFNHEKAMDVLINEKGTQNVESLCLNFGDQLSEEDDVQNEELFMKLSAQNFKNMPQLRLLQLDSAIIIDDFKDVFTKLRWLRWQRCPKDFKATNVNMEKLIILDVSGSAITENWGGWKLIQMVNLKVLNLARCTGLLATPPLDALPELERLKLEGCLRLAHINSTIGVLKCLKFLNLKFCRELRKLPRELGDLEALQELLIDGTRVEEIPEIDKLKGLEILSSADCISLGCIPDSVGKLEKLRILSLRGCRRIQKLPDNMEALGSSLVELDISGTGVIEIPRSIAGLKSLKVLRMESCHITELPITFVSLLKLEEIHASCCRNLEDVTSEIGKLSQLKILELRYAGISGLPNSIKNLGKLEVLDLLHCDNIKQLPKLPSTLKLLHVNPELQPEIQYA